MSIQQETELRSRFAEFLARYYKDEIAQLANVYPQESKSLWVDAADLFKYDNLLLDDLRENPSGILPELHAAINDVDIPLDMDLSGAKARVYNLDDTHIYAPGEIRKEQANRFIGVQGTLERVTTTSDMPESVVFECQRCNTLSEVEQSPADDELQEPYECEGCERQGPFKWHEDKGKWSDYAKLRVEARPDASEDASGKQVGYVLNDLIDHGGPSGLVGRAGEPVTVYGTIERVQKQGRGENKLLFDHVLKVNSIEFDRDDETVDVEDHKDEFMGLAERPGAVDLFAESIAPNLHKTEPLEAACEFAVAYLFGAPRIDIPRGPTYRGDLHFLIISGYGMGKSQFSEDIESYSPKCIRKSATSLGSEVGLTAAAVEDDFGEGAWTIKPGLLVRANGGHLVLDEIDKTKADLEKMNDAIEGKQQVDVEKAGQSVTYDSRTGVMALGNPVDSRFNPNEPISPQLGLAESLLSRFDGIVTMEDVADEEQDKKIAGAWGKSYTEAQQAEYSDREDFEQLERAVPVDVGQAWIEYARENVTPLLSYEQFRDLEEWYASEVRQLNHKYSSGGGAGEDMPVPATVRVLGSAVKMSIAFARARLQDEVREPQVERAKKLGKRLVKQNWNGERFDASKDVGAPDTQQKQVRAILDCIEDAQKPEGEIVEATGIDPSTVEHRLERLYESGEVICPVGSPGAGNAEYRRA